VLKKILTKKISYNYCIGLITLGIIFFILGIIFFISNLFFFMIPRFAVSSSELGAFFASIGLGLIAIGIAVGAIWFSLKTDKLVKSLADLNFDEKIAALEGNTMEIKLLINPHPWDDNIPILTGLIKNDFKAISNIRQYASDKKKEDLIRNIIITFLKDVANDKLKMVSKPDIDEIIIIARTYKIDIAIINTIQNTFTYI